MADAKTSRRNYGLGRLSSGVCNRLRILQKIRIAESIGVMTGSRVPLLYAHSDSIPNNFGDAISPWLFEKISGCSPVSSQHVANFTGKPTYVFIGSILDCLNLKNAVVCGAGFIQDNSCVHFPPQKVLAVRGPLSRKVFLDLGIDCPEVYGDPALLLPEFFSPCTNKEWDVGIIPHYADKETLAKTTIISHGLSFKIIDIESNPEQVMNDIGRSSCILSSSLHGIITAHAFGVPAAWVKFSDKLLGGDFKFHDYSLAVANIRLTSRTISNELELATEAAFAVLLDTKIAATKLRAVLESHFRSNNSTMVEK